jgi:hypothetical protein
MICSGHEETTPSSLKELEEFTKHVDVIARCFPSFTEWVSDTETFARNIFLDSRSTGDAEVASVRKAWKNVDERYKEFKRHVSVFRIPVLKPELI